MGRFANSACPKMGNGTLRILHPNAHPRIGRGFYNALRLSFSIEWEIISRESHMSWQKIHILLLRKFPQMVFTK